MQARYIIILAILVLLAVSCTSEPETLIETVVHEVEVTRLIEQDIEVTREVEVTRLVEVTRAILQEIEVPVEVTRLIEVEIIITTTPEPTPEPTAEPSATAPPAEAQVPSQETAGQPAQDLATTLLEIMETTRSFMHSFGGQIDAGLRGDPFNCWDSVYAYDAIVQAPTLDVSSASPEVQSAYGHYRGAIDIYREGATAMATNCRELIEGTKESASIGYQQWSIARSHVNEAVDMITPGIQMLGGE